MSNKIPTPHINAKSGDFAKIVLMPGDPLRAKFIADNYLSNVKEINSVRGMLAFTGEYKGKKISVMGHGMGIPSIGIYSYELFNFYGVETIIRIGSCGSFVQELNLGDIVIGSEALSFSTYAEAMGLEVENSTIGASKEIVDKTNNIADKLNIKVTNGKILSSDAFYGKNNGEYINSLIDKKEILAVEMEAYALYVNAKIANKKALTILTVSDSLVTKQEMTAEQRQIGFRNMMELALETAISLME